MFKDSELLIGGRKFPSRLFLGTGKFSSLKLMKETLEASGASAVTVALKRANLGAGKDASADISDYLDSSKYLVLPNTSGAVNAEEAVRIAPALEILSNWRSILIPTTFCPTPLKH